MRHVKELSAILDSDPLIDEVGTVRNTAYESFFVVDEGVRAHKLGIPSHIVAATLSAAHSALTGDAKTTAVEASAAQVLMNGDCYLAWNVRRRAVRSGIITDCDGELRLAGLLLSRHPKAYEAWSYRRWVIGEFILSKRTDGGRHWQRREPTVCEGCSVRYPRNYYAWQHRLWVLGHLSDDDDDEAIASEYLWSEQWVRRHVSDHSGVHYRQRVLLRYKGGSDAAVWRTEFALIRCLIVAFPGHESLWEHLRFLVHHWVSFVRGCGSGNAGLARVPAWDDPSTAEGCHEEELPIAAAGIAGLPEGTVQWPTAAGIHHFADRVRCDATSAEFQAQSALAARFIDWLHNFGGIGQTQSPKHKAAEMK